MPDTTNKDDETEIAAQRLFESMAMARRRPRPRVAEPFRKGAEDKIVETSNGGVEDGPELWRRAIAEALRQC